MPKVLSALAKPFTETVGLARWMLVIGVVITAVFVICALFAPWLAPYSFDQTSVDGVRFPKAAAPERRPPLRHRPACSSTSCRA